MPLLAVLTTAAHIARRVNNSLFKQREPQRTEVWRGDDIEPTVAVKQRWIISVELETFLVDQEQRNLGTVFTGNKDLLGLVSIWFETGNIDGPKHCRLLRRDVVLVNGAREVERREVVENILVVIQTTKTTGRSHARQSDLIFQVARKTKHVSTGCYILPPRSK